MMNSITKKMLFVIAFVLMPLHTIFAMEVAITVDDLPANGDLAPNMTRREIAKKMLFVFKQHQIRSVYGLINGNKLDEPGGIDILKEWIQSGNYLGNHTFHHLDLAKIDSVQYTDDIRQNESILSRLMPYNDYHYFRYPFLSEGNTQEKRDAVRQFLAKNDYKIAPVTIDFFEYEWNDPYVRCLKKHDQKSIEWLKKTYIEQANNALTVAHELSTMLFNRDVKNVMLIHINSFTAIMLDDLLNSYAKHHVKFISLPNALSDPIYQINPNIVLDRPYTFLNQVRLSKSIQNPEIVANLYESLPENELNHLCR